MNFDQLKAKLVTPKLVQPKLAPKTPVKRKAFRAPLKDWQELMQRKRVERENASNRV